jgi:hypothetical protein
MPGKPIWSNDATSTVSYVSLQSEIGPNSQITAIRLTGEEATVIDVTGIAATHKSFICAAVNAGTLEVDVMLNTRTNTGVTINLPTANDRVPSGLNFYLGTITGDPDNQVPDITITGYIQSVSVSAERDDVIRATVVFRCTGASIHNSNY